MKGPDKKRSKHVPMEELTDSGNVSDKEIDDGLAATSEPAPDKNTPKHKEQALELARSKNTKKRKQERMRKDFMEEPDEKRGKYAAKNFYSGPDPDKNIPKHNEHASEIAHSKNTRKRKLERKDFMEEPDEERGKYAAKNTDSDSSNDPDSDGYHWS